MRYTTTPGGHHEIPHAYGTRRGRSTGYNAVHHRRAGRARPAARLHVQADPVLHGQVAARGARLPAVRRSANMTYHGGKILTTAVSKAIFWGPSWTNSTFVGDKITGLDSWYTGQSGSNYADASNEYTDTVNGGHQVGSTLTHQGHIIDTSTASGGASTSSDPQRGRQAGTAGNIVLDANGNSYIPVYTDVKRGNAGYCAWHSSGTISGTTVQFAFFFNLDGDPGCDPGDTHDRPQPGPGRARERHRARTVRSPVRSRPAPAPGTTPAALRTATSARGRSTSRPSRSPTARAGSCKASGATPRTRPAPATRTHPASGAASTAREPGLTRFTVPAQPTPHRRRERRDGKRTKLWLREIGRPEGFNAADSGWIPPRANLLHDAETPAGRPGLRASAQMVTRRAARAALRAAARSRRWRLPSICALVARWVRVRVPDAGWVPGLHETVLQVRMDVEKLEEHRGQPGDDDGQDPHVERDGQQQEGQGDGNRELDE